MNMKLTRTRVEETKKKTDKILRIADKYTSE